MKRIFIILCLITICNISYGDIASVGYVDSVVATKQDTITDIETIRTGAGLGATAVQPSSLSTVATSGSYNDLSNKPTIPSLPTGPSDGIYKMVWNGRFKTFMFQKESDVLTCSSGTYDIGFSQCIDPSTEGTNNDHDAAAMTWWVDFPYGRVSGIASCTPDSSSWGTAYPDRDYEQTVTGQYCYCKMTHPVSSAWVSVNYTSSTSDCSANCAYYCRIGVHDYAAFRGGVFGSAGN